MTLKLVDRILLKMSQIFQIKYTSTGFWNLCLQIITQYDCVNSWCEEVLTRTQPGVPPLSLNLLYTKRIFQDWMYLSPYFFLLSGKLRVSLLKCFPHPPSFCGLRYTSCSNCGSSSYLPRSFSLAIKDFRLLP